MDVITVIKQEEWLGNEKRSVVTKASRTEFDSTVKLNS
jgi:hypothetical protein